MVCRRQTCSPVVQTYAGKSPVTEMLVCSNANRLDRKTNVRLFTPVAGCVQVVALHKEHYVFPITLVVTRVSGTGAEAVFMGVIKPSAEDPDAVKAWITPGGKTEVACGEYYWEFALAFAWY